MNSKQRFICMGDDAGKRLDVFLSEHLENISRSLIQKNIKDGKVIINGKIINKKNFIIAQGMDITINSSVMVNNSKHNPVPQNIPLNIVYEDKFLIVINKPQGMVVHPATSHNEGTLVNALIYHSDNLSDVNGVHRAGIVHRIDKDTSGLLVVAKDNFVHRHLAQQFKDKTTSRLYEAIVYGGFNMDNMHYGTVDKAIARHPKNRLKRAVVEGGKSAITHYKVLEQYGKYSHISLKLETGRTHQIRVHMSYIGHPILCDELYGIKNEKIKHNGQILHARTLGFMHPIIGEYMEFSSDLPEYFIKILNKVKNSTIKGRG